MQLQHLADFNLASTKKAGVDHKAESKAFKADDAEQGTPFKDQVDKHIDQSKAESNQNKTNNNQQDSTKEGDASDETVASDSDVHASQSEVSEQSENNINTELKTDDGQLADEVTVFNNMLNVTLTPSESPEDSGPLMASALPETGKQLPLSTALPSQVVSQQALSSKEMPVIQQTALTQKTVAPAVSPIVTAMPDVDPELVGVDSKAFKSVVVSEKPGFLNTQGTTVKSELPAAEMIANASRMQQVPLATALSDSLGIGQNIHASPTPAAATANLSATMSSAASLSSSLSTAIGAPVQGSEWPRQMTEQVSMMVKGEFQQAELKLNPAHLGPLEVKLHISDDKANISFVTQHAPVRDAIDSAIPRLREMLEEQGLNLVNVDVSTQSEQQQANEDAQQALNADPDVNISDADVITQGVTSSVEVEIDTGLSLYA